MIQAFTESLVEEAALSWFEGLGYAVLHGPDIAPEEPNSERETFGDVVLKDRLRASLGTINPDIPADALDDAVRKMLITESPSLHENNRRFHQFLVEGVPVEYRSDGRTIHANARLFDFRVPGTTSSGDAIFNRTWGLLWDRLETWRGSREWWRLVFRVTDRPLGAPIFVRKVERLREFPGRHIQCETRMNLWRGRGRRVEA